MNNDNSRISPLWYALGGAAIGVAAGLLLAPKKGSELLLDLNELGREGREKSRTLMSKLGSMVPLRVKSAAVMGALKAGGAEAVEMVKQDLHVNGTL